MLVKRKIICTNSFLQNRTKESECKYKSYKNKLTSILRFCEKEYYNKLLVKEKTIQRVHGNFLIQL